MNLNLFSITSFTIFVSSIGFALILYIRNRTSGTNRSWLLFSTAIGFWGLGLGGVTASHTVEYASAWQYLLDISASLIPVTYLVFVSNLTKIRLRKTLIFSWVASGSLALLSLTTLFRAGMIERYGFHWINPGPLYILFPLYFVIVIGYSVWLLYRTFRADDTDKILKAQTGNMLLAGVIGFSGGFTNFFPQVFDIYPFGNYFIILYVFFVSYGVLRYKMFEAKVVSAQLISGALSLIFFFKILLPTTFNEWLLNLGLFGAVILFSIFLVKGVYREVSQREKIEKLAQDLEKANARLRELDKQKSEFVSFASHQLRSPLTAIKGYASLILEGDMGEVNKETHDAVDRIFESSKTLTSVVDDYLNISRIELGTMKFNFELLDLRDMVKNTVGELKPNFDKAGVAYELHLAEGKSCRVNADPDKLKQVVANLIDNSMKYSPKGKVDISVTSDDKTKVVRFTVADSGIGMSTVTLGKIFSKFTRAENANLTNIRGTGLGLYVAKDIIGSHKGKIWAESDGEGKGSRFIFELGLA